MTMPGSDHLLHAQFTINGLDSKVLRAIDVRQNESINMEHLQELLQAAYDFDASN